MTAVGYFNFNKITCLVLFFSLINFQVISQPRAVKKAGKHLDRISELDYTLRVQGKTGPKQAAMKMMQEVTALKEINQKIADTEKMKEPLTAFVGKWLNKELIYASITSTDKDVFMMDVSYLKTFTPTKRQWKTLFPLFRP